MQTIHLSLTITIIVIHRSKLISAGAKKKKYHEVKITERVRIIKKNKDIPMDKGIIEVKRVLVIDSLIRIVVVVVVQIKIKIMIIENILEVFLFLIPLNLKNK